MGKEENHLNVESVGVKSKKQGAYKLDCVSNPRRVQKPPDKVQNKNMKHTNMSLFLRFIITIPTTTSSIKHGAKICGKGQNEYSNEAENKFSVAGNSKHKVASARMYTPCVCAHTLRTYVRKNKKIKEKKDRLKNNQLIDAKGDLNKFRYGNYSRTKLEERKKTINVIKANNMDISLFNDMRKKEKAGSHRTGVENENASSIAMTRCKESEKNKKSHPPLIKIKSNDMYLNNLLKKEDILIQSEKCQEANATENKNIASSSNEPTEGSSDEDFHSSDVIELYKKKQQQNLEEKRKKFIRDKKKMLIRKKTYKDTGTQVFLDDFTKFYERVKPEVEKIVEDVLNRALKEIYEEQELTLIKRKIDYYENIRMKKYKALKNVEKKSEAFYEETQRKINDRIALKNKVEIIMKKKIAHSKAHKNVYHIFQKNVDLCAREDSLPKNFEVENKTRDIPTYQEHEPSCTAMVNRIDTLFGKDTPTARQILYTHVHVMNVPVKTSSTDMLNKAKQ
ncbi:conserved Plasmodium protein, unknown function [Plasmodium ovale curtisi]|uniref:Uncharacterized protein n=1 Tax=Plasmodium ovale curtisi TaxID=864141 RepID=A0A1A8X0Z4_PLAOA|nr:conserved Plasmodium protein, unknown function [Plasmodium ovale curtisi]